jgi:hypothetical protein
VLYLLFETCAFLADSAAGGGRFRSTVCLTGMWKAVCGAGLLHAACPLLFLFIGTAGVWLLS